MFTDLINISSTKDSTYKLFVFPVLNTSGLLNAAAGAFFMQNQSFCRVDKTGSVVLLTRQLVCCVQTLLLIGEHFKHPLKTAAQLFNKTCPCTWK